MGATAASLRKKINENPNSPMNVFYDAFATTWEKSNGADTSESAPASSNASAAAPTQSDVTVLGPASNGTRKKRRENYNVASDNGGRDVTAA